VALALTRGEPTVPVLYVDLDPAMSVGVSSPGSALTTPKARCC
jgi:hypothetical protein